MTQNVKLKLMGKKRGMMQLFDQNGHVVACTVIEVEPNVVTQVKNKEVDGYAAVQLGFDVVKTKDPRTIDQRVTKPLQGHFKKAGVEPRRRLAETAIESAGDYQVGQEIGVEFFSDISFVDVTSTSKGKGYQGVMKLYNFAGGPASHGSGFHRRHGSTGMRSTPGRVLPGGKIAKRMGCKQVTIQGLKVMKVLPDDGIIIVKGCVPGPKGGYVTIGQAVKNNQPASAA